MIALHRRTGLCAVLLLLLCVFPVLSVAGELPYRIKRTDISIPDGASLGDIQRTFRPFPNWTLICDENLRTRTRVCNAVETFVDPSGVTIFSWSLAASESGNPIFILRAPPEVGPKGLIVLRLSDGEAVSAKVHACDATTCIAMLPVGRRLQDEIRRADPITISYTAGKPMELHAPLYGLAKAINSIN